MCISIRRLVLLFSVIGLFLVGCGSEGPVLRNYNVNDIRETTVTIDRDPEVGIKPIDIKSRDFFRMVQPWKDGKLATIDGWGRFSEISFMSHNTIQIKPLIDFPKVKLDNHFIVWPDANLFYARTNFMVHLADIGTQTKKSIMPYFSGLYWQPSVSLLDPDEGLVVLVYQNMNNPAICHNVIYNFKKDVVVYEDKQETKINMDRPLNKEWIISRTINDNYNVEIYLYNWKTGEIKRNKMTEALSHANLATLFFGYGDGINLKRRCIMGASRALQKKVKISWSEDYEDVSVLPLDYLLPADLSFTSDTFFFSPNGEWATTPIGFYRGLNGDMLKKRVFIHMDDRYPEGISMLVFAEGYDNYSWDYGTFFNHADYGWCYAGEYHKNEGGKNQLYLRLYKMNDVLAEINRQLLEEANDVPH
jgi:hypothetical protein